MFDWLRNLRKTEEEKRQEQLTAYIDGELSPAERTAFEQELADDDALQAEVEAQQQVRLLLREAPRLRAPRNFTLDPAVYGAAQQPSLATRLYPQLRVATAVMAVLLVGVISLEFLTGAGSRNLAAPAQDIAQVEEAAPAAEEPETFAIETETETAESQTAPAAEEAPAEAPAAESGEAAADGAEDEAAADEAEFEVMEAEEADAEEETAAEDEAIAPRPEATAAPDTRTEALPAPTLTPLPTPTLEPPDTAAVGATIAAVQPTVLPETTAEPPLSQPAPPPPNFLRWAQIIIGIATAVLLALTLYGRRQR